MKKKYWFMLGCIIPVSPAISAELASSEYFRYYEFPSFREAAKADDVNWSVMTPKGLLDELIRDKDAGRLYFPIYCYHFNWVKAEHMPYLVALIDSVTPCAQVGFFHSSLASTKPSTIGAEARHMIVAYWKGYYPAALGTEKISVSSGEIKSWYEIWRKGRMAQKGSGFKS